MSESTTFKIDTEDIQVQVLKIYKEKCHGAESNTPMWNTSGLFCPRTWDGVICWPATRAGEIVAQYCPYYVHGFDTKGIATKECTSSGHWYSKPGRIKPWTNISGCYHDLTAPLLSPFKGIPNTSYIEEYIPHMKMISRVGFSLSLVTLLIALVVLATNKRLRCPRNVVHMNLFISFIMKGFLMLLKDSFYVNGVGLSFTLNENNTIFYSNSTHLCKFVTTMWEYSKLANYSWILMEGLYLHNLIFLALFSDTSSIKLYVILGWGLPILILLSWVGLRLGFLNPALTDDMCWLTNMTTPYIRLMIEVPISISILINAVLFVNIVRVLLRKIKATFVEKPQTYRKWAKSTLVLVPLFGVHYAFFVCIDWIPPEHRSHTTEIVWIFCDQFFSAFQGLLVAVLYCFLNGEVKAELNKMWQSIRRKNSSGRKLSTATKSSSIHGTYCTTASCGSLNSLKWGNSRVGQPIQYTNEKKIPPFCPQLTETTRLNTYGNFNATHCEENYCDHPSYNRTNIELGCLIPWNTCDNSVQGSKEDIED